MGDNLMEIEQKPTAIKHPHGWVGRSPLGQLLSTVDIQTSVELLGSSKDWCLNTSFNSEINWNWHGPSVEHYFKARAFKLEAKCTKDYNQFRGASGAARRLIW